MKFASIYFKTIVARDGFSGHKVVFKGWKVHKSARTTDSEGYTNGVGLFNCYQFALAENSGCREAYLEMHSKPKKTTLL